MKRLAAGLALIAMTAGAANAADLIVDTPVYDAAMAAAYDWSGFYAGGFVGYGSGTSAFTGGFGTSVDVPLTGALAGVDIGFNYQTGNFVLGLEGDVAWSGISGSVACTNPGFDCSTDLHWLGTVRGRLGYAVDSVLLFATGGIAFGTASSDTPPYTPGVTYDSTHVGWTLGAGAEVAVTDNVSLKAEYLYVNLGSQTDTNALLDGPDTTIGISAHTVRAGLNFHF